MNQSAVWLIILLALLLANLPFINHRLLVFGKTLHPKTFSLRLLEWLLAYGLTGLFAYGLEAAQGKAFNQGWEFYAITLCLFLVLAFPGFVWCYLYRHVHTKAE